MEDYKQRFIELNRALTALKRGKPSDWDLEVLGCAIDEFWTCNQYIVANNFNVKERAEFVKTLEKRGVDLFDAAWLKQDLDLVRRNFDMFPGSAYLQGLEAALSNLLFNRGLDLRDIEVVDAKYYEGAGI